MLSRKSIDKFVRHQNVERYRRLLENVTDENRRDHLLKLLAEAKQKQKVAKDPEYLYKNGGGKRRSDFIRRADGATLETRLARRSLNR
jgi:hypothetical protein